MSLPVKAIAGFVLSLALVQGARAQTALPPAAANGAGQTPAPAAGSASAGQAAPTSPDIAQLFRAQVSAITGSGSARRVLLSSTTAKGRSERRLKVGDTFQDGWILASLTAEQAVLSRGVDRLTIDLSTAAQPAAGPQKTVITLGSLGMYKPPPPPEEDVAADETPQVDPALVQAVAVALSQMQAPPAPAEDPPAQ